MIDKEVGRACTGCTACCNTCPKSAIQMEADSEGFCYPSVDYKKCVRCGLCEKTCPIVNAAGIKTYSEPRVYAAWNINPEIRINSTSGGVFSALSDAVIQRGGSVVGARYDERFNVVHSIIDDLAGIEALRQSKYVQSDLGDIFQQVRSLLERGKLVLFCGTPCQSAGLQMFLRKEYENLYCCDFICRGVISRKVYHKYLEGKSAGQAGTLSKVHFKNKDFGWNRFSTKLGYSDGSFYQQDRYHDSYLKGYLNYNLYLRPSCHACKFKQIPRKSDLSLGDFWGIGMYKKELDTDCGTSVILVNSTKGQKLLSWIWDSLVIEERSLDEVIKGNACLLNVAPEGEYREFFFSNLDRMKFDKLIQAVEEKVMGLSVKDKILRRLHLWRVRVSELICR